MTPIRGAAGSCFLRTIDLARDVGIHPNTVRLYEAWGYLPPAERSTSGYRLFTRRHLEHLRLARLLRGTEWPGRSIYRSATALIVAAAHDPVDLRREAADHLELVRRQRSAADEACAIARRWLTRRGSIREGRPFRSAEAARQVGITYDALRSWERNGLIVVARDVHGHRRFEPADSDRLAVILALRTAGYSPLAILRMLQAADAGRLDGALDALTTPERDPDLVTASDRWAATLADQERRAAAAVELMERLGGHEPSTSAPGS